MKKITVKASRDYEILIEAGILKEAGSHIRKVVRGNRAVLVTDDVVEKWYLEPVKQSLEAEGFCVEVFVIENGETSKDMAHYAALLEFLAARTVTRSDVLVALGGGVVGDLTGFAAATYLRGVDFVQIPTTLLAAVDSSVGGKTAIDLKAGKNLAGCFYQPSLVLCDCETLKTLPPEIFADGMAEVIKYGAIQDEELWEKLKEPIWPQIEEIVARCVTIKKEIVQQDEYDHGVRQYLNFGHTIGHSVEKNSQYAVSHGRAVAMGMVLAVKMSLDQGACEAGCLEEMKAMLERYHLPLWTEYSPEQLCEPMKSDKKRAGDTISFILLRRIGECFSKKMKIQEMETAVFGAMGENYGSKN